MRYRLEKLVKRPFHQFFFTPFQSFLYFSIRAAAQTQQDVRWLGPTLTSRNLWNAGLASLAILTASLALRKLSMYAEYILARVSLENWRGEEEQETYSELFFSCVYWAKIVGSSLLNVKICCISVQIHVILNVMFLGFGLLIKQNEPIIWL